jgi:hypothetical protein
VRPEALFKLLRSYLGQLGITEADQVLFVADGARWIWNRISALVHGLGLNPEQIYELIDFYHAVEHLEKVAGLRKSWTAKQRKVWVRKSRRLLRQGQADKVMNTVQGLRKKAKDAGNLKSSEQQKVTVDASTQQTIIKIEPTDPQIVYVPTYNPTIVYGTW